MSATQLIEKGRKAYAEKNYDDAVRLFSRALAMSKDSIDSQITTLDLRCQAYSKSGRLDPALQDARRIIQTSNRQSPVGYLRCSQIEKALGNFAAARKWLEHGIKNVPQHKQSFENQLTKVNDFARTQIVLCKRRDPIALMPLELLEVILSYLEYSECIVLLRVSRTWRNLLFKLPPLVCTIDFSSTRKQIPWRTWKTLSERLGRQSKSLTLAPLAPSAVKAVEGWLSKSTNLETIQKLHVDRTEVALNSIRFENLKRLKSLHIGPDQKITFNTVQRLIAICQSLEDLTVNGDLRETNLVTLQTQQLCLRHLRLHQTSGFEAFIMPPIILRNWPNLQTLYLTDAVLVDSEHSTPTLDLSSHMSLQKLHLSIRLDDSVELNLPESLNELACRTVSGSTRWNISNPITLQNLHTIDMKYVETFGLIDALESSLVPPRLRSMRIVEVPFREALPTQPVRAYSTLEACQELSYHASELKDRDSEAFRTLFPAVVKLALEAPFITGNFISDLVESPSCQLREIVLKDCYRVSSDIVTWLNSRGISCRVVKSIDELKGQRVRTAW